MNKPLILIGNGGHASVLTEALMSTERKIIGYTAPEPQINKFRLNYLGSDEIINRFNPSEIELVLGIGTVNVCDKRERLFNEYKRQGFSFANVLHPLSLISPTVTLGEGVHIMAGSILQSYVQISDNSIINTGVIIDHDCVIEAHVHIAPGCNLSGGVRVGHNSHLGTGTTIIQNRKIGHHALIGAGSVVVNDIESCTKVLGVPAKEV